MPPQHPGRTVDGVKAFDQRSFIAKLIQPNIPFLRLVVAIKTVFGQERPDGLLERWPVARLRWGCNWSTGSRRMAGRKKRPEQYRCAKNSPYASRGDCFTAARRRCRIRRP